MLLSDLLSHAAMWRDASNMPPATPASLTPLMLTDAQLDELVDGTDLTVEQWLQVAYNGIILLPHDIDFPTE